MREVTHALDAYNRWTARLPDINRFRETDYILDERDFIERHKSELSAQELDLLATVDARVRRNAKLISDLLAVDPQRYRDKHGVPAHYWWRHLDLIESGEYIEAAA